MSNNVLTGQYIHGQHEIEENVESFENINPANGKSLGTVLQATDTQVENAVDSAIQGFKVWSKMSGVERSRVMLKAVALLRERNDELAAIEVEDNGKAIQEALEVDIATGADAIEYFAGLANNLHGEHIDLDSAFVYSRREPLGICVGIGAWNYPMQIACWKSAPALACGNAMIFKPSELTPRTALKLAEIYREAGLPDGVFNVLQGDARVGKALVAHEKVAKVSITGEIGTGKKIMSSAADTLKHVTMELGGKSPIIVFDDCDLDNAVSATMLGNFYTQGEVCSNGTRVFVHEKIHDEFLQRLTERASKIKLGNPMHESTQMGALISKQHMDLVLKYIESGVAEGARLATGGKQYLGDGLENGFFVEPTIFADCTDDMTIVKEEIFGPVASVLKFKEEEEVIGRANNTDMGLAAGVFTQNIQKAHRVVAQLDAGVCWINNYNLTPSGMNFGGYKQSGIGRENGASAIDHYTQLKSVYVELADVESPY